MCGGKWQRAGAILAPGLLVLILNPAGRADDNGFFSRLFRLGGNSSSSSSPSFPAAPGSTGRSGNTNGPGNNPAAHDRSTGSAFGDIGSGGTFSPMAGSNRAPSPTPASGPIAVEGPSTPSLDTPGASPRLTPRSRVSPAVTSADPLLTRLALGRSNDGGQFGMILQVFADGTVIDSEGVHHLAAADLKPLTEAVQNGELLRLRGHCGTPSNDFIEYVHIVVFERRMGRLQAHSFSYSGNPQGCDSSLRHLHSALDNLQAKLSRQPSSTASSSPGPIGNGGPAPLAAGGGNAAALGSNSAPALPDPSTPAGSATVIPLTPIPPR
jgi:hypothetical protein